MDRLAKDAILLELISNMEKKGSWCGETHIQKATFFLQELTVVGLGFDFTLYKHGPFSFDLRDELTSLRADNLLELIPRGYTYGPSFSTTALGEALKSRFPKTIDAFRSKIDYITESVGNKGVIELEKIATAFFVSKKEMQQEDLEKKAVRLNQIKPHISLEDARKAFNDCLKLEMESVGIINT